MAPTQPSGRAPLTRRGIRLVTVAALLGAGVLAASALASPTATREGTTVTSVATLPANPGPGAPSAPKGVWMAFEVNPPLFALRPLRKFAACVRRHGIRGFADPKVVDGKVVLMLPHGLTAKSPRLKAAQRACQKLLPQGANTQPGTGTGPTTTRPAGTSTGPTTTQPKP
jgi:hypothetical protein